MKPVMNHKIIEVCGLDREILKDFNSIIPSIQKLILKTDLKVLKIESHNFSPQGVTALFILSSSHLAVHTWPEYGYLHIDFLTCSPTLENLELKRAVMEIWGLPQENIEVREVKYG